MSENKRYYWLKLQENFFDDDTIDFIESQESGEKYVLFYLKLCLKALKNEGKLIRYVGEMLLPYDDTGLAKLTRTDIDVVRSALMLFSKIGLIKKLDTGEIFLTQLNEMVGTETQKAKYMRQRRVEQKGNNVTPMLPECYTDIEIDIEKEKEKDTYTDSACVSSCNLPDSNLPEYKAEPKNFQSFCKDCFETITQHNKDNKDKMAVSRDFFAFSSKEGRELAKLIQSETMENLIQALKNYLLVSKLDTWKTGFSFNAFCKNYTEYLPEFFNAIKYLKNVPKGGEVELINEARKKFIQNGQRFRVQTFIYHRKDWINMGMPENIETLCQRWLEEDEQNGIDYKAEIEEWKKLMGGEEK